MGETSGVHPVPEHSRPAAIDVAAVVSATMAALFDWNLAPVFNGGVTEALAALVVFSGSSGESPQRLNEDLAIMPTARIRN